MITEPATRLNRAADELHRVGEIRERGKRHHATVCRMVKLVNVRRQRREDVQDGLQPIQRIGLQQRGGHGREIIDVMRQHLAVLGEERARDGEQAVELLDGVRQVRIGVGQPVGELRKVLVQRDELLVVLM